MATAGLIAVGCAIGHAAPTELLLGSYAFIGPAHYLTEISWLHDRRPLAGRSGLLLPMMALMGLLMWASPTMATMLAVMAGGCSLLVSEMAANGLPRAALTGVCTGGCVYAAATYGSTAALSVVMLFPTAVHVGIYTALWLWKAARGRATAAGLLAPAVFVLCLASFAVLPSSRYTHIAWAATSLRFFGEMVQLLNPYAGADYRPGVVGALGLCYWTSYVGWFARTGATRWHDVGPMRLAALCAAWAVITAAYAYDFAAGFLLSLPLSVGHVMLELPPEGRRPIVPRAPRREPV